MTRVFRDEDVTHVDGEVNPASDISTIQTELILADLQTVEKAIPRLEKEARGNKALAANLDAAREALAGARGRYADHRDRRSTASLIRELSLLTAKPFIYVFNCDADELADETLKDQMREIVAPAEAIFLDAKFESELVELDDDDEAREMLAEMGVDEPGLDVLWPASASTPSACRPTSPPAPRRRGPGRSARAPPPPRPPASSTPTSSAASSRPRSSPSTT